MDGGVLIIGKVVRWSVWVPKGLRTGGFRLWAVGCMALGGLVHSSYFSSFFLNAIFVDFLRFCRFWGTCWQAKWKPKSIFATFFPTFFSSAFRDLIFVVFWKLRASKIMLSPRREHDFHKIDVFENDPKKPRFWIRFGRSKRRKIKKSMC